MTDHNMIMDDEERFLVLMNQWKVQVEREEDKAGRRYRIDPGSGPVEGHFGFYADFTFDKNGKFLSIGIWE